VTFHAAREFPGDYLLAIHSTPISCTLLTAPVRTSSADFRAPFSTSHGAFAVPSHYRRETHRRKVSSTALMLEGQRLGCYQFHGASGGEHSSVSELASGRR